MVYVIYFCLSEARNIFEKFQKYWQTNPAFQAMFGNVCLFGQTIRHEKESKNVFRALFGHLARPLSMRP